MIIIIAARRSFDAFLRPELHAHKVWKTGFKILVIAASNRCAQFISWRELGGRSVSSRDANQWLRRRKL
jgi:hypothetical protein